MKLKQLQAGFRYTLKTYVDEDLELECILEAYSDGSFSVLESSFEIDGVKFRDPQPDIVHEIRDEDYDYVIVDKEALNYG